MLNSILAQCLEPHKRLVVPGLGAFIVKEPGRCVVFTELLKRDDGVLRQALLERGEDEAQSAQLIDDFVSEVHRIVGQGGEVRISGLGVLHPGARGTIAFVFDPQVDSVATAAENLATEKEPYAAPSAEPVAAAQAEKNVGVQAEKGAEVAVEKAVEAPVEKTTEKSDAAASGPVRTDRLAQALRSAYEEHPVSTSARMSPDPAVRGLRYSKPRKTTDAYTYVDASSHRHHHRHHHHRRRSGWVVWVVALLAILISLCAIGYKPYREWREQKELDKFLKQNGLPSNVTQPEQPQTLDDLIEQEHLEP